jgi:hypothetical protein
MCNYGFIVYIVMKVKQIFIKQDLFFLCLQNYDLDAIFNECQLIEQDEAAVLKVRHVAAYGVASIIPHTHMIIINWKLLVVNLCYVRKWLYNFSQSGWQFLH